MARRPVALGPHRVSARSSSIATTDSPVVGEGWWPALPPEPAPTEEEWAAALRAREHWRRLDREQEQGGG